MSFSSDSETVEREVYQIHWSTRNRDFSNLFKRMITDNDLKIIYKFLPEQCQGSDFCFEVIPENDEENNDGVIICNDDFVRIRKSEFPLSFRKILEGSEFSDSIEIEGYYYKIFWSYYWERPEKLLIVP